MRPEEDKQRQAEMVEKWISTIKDSKSLPSADVRTLESPDWWKPEHVDPEVEEAITGFRRSKQLLEQLGDDADSGPVANSFVLPLGVVLAALPAKYVNPEGVSAVERTRPIRVFLDDLYEQLATGRITISVARLVFGVPVGMISSVALRDTETRVSLLLKDVVAAIGSSALQARVAKPKRRYDIGSLPELFAPPKVAPVSPAEPAPVSAPALVEPVVQASVPVTVPEQATPADCPVVPPPVVDAVAPVTPVVPEVPVEPVVDVPVAEVAPVTPMPRPAKPAPRVAPEAYVNVAALERLNGVDLNAAMSPELLTLPGVTPMVANAILEYRAQQGPFANLFDLAQVPRVGRLTFRKITGMPYSRMGHHRRDVLGRCLELPPAAIGHVPTIVRTIASKPGLTGCVMSDRDGLLLAESGVGSQATALSAIVPRLISQIDANMRELGGGGVTTLSVTCDGRLMTVVASGGVYLTVVHAAGRLTSSLQKFLRRVASEVEWLFSRRGYVNTTSASIVPDEAHDA